MALDDRIEAKNKSETALKPLPQRLQVVPKPKLKKIHLLPIKQFFASNEDVNLPIGIFHRQIV